MVDKKSKTERLNNFLKDVQILKIGVMIFTQFCLDLNSILLSLGLTDARGSRCRFSRNCLV